MPSARGGQMITMTPASGGAELRTYARMWGVQQALILAFGGLRSSGHQIQAALIGGGALLGAPALLAPALFLRAYECASAWPNAWESHYWCAQTDVALLLALFVEFLEGPRPMLSGSAAGGGTNGARSSASCAAPKGQQQEHLPSPQSLSMTLWRVNAASDCALREAARTVRWQLVCFYGSAALLKLNSSFLDPRYSCASIYMAQLLGGYLAPSLAQSAGAVLAVRTAPCVVVAGELLLTTSLALAAAHGGGDAPGRLGRAAAGLAVLLAVLLHFGIAMTPPPNNIGAFSVIMAVRLFLVAPATFTSVAAPRPGSTRALSTAAVVVVAALLGSAAAALAVAGGEYAAAFGTPGVLSAAAAGGSVERGLAEPPSSAGQIGIMFCGGMDWSVPAFVAIAAALCAGSWRLLSREATLEAGTRAPAEARGLARTAHAAVRCVLVAVAAVHCFALPSLGLQDIGGSNMYGNLRLVGGSNHLFLPTAAPQLVLAHAGPSPAPGTASAAAAADGCPHWSPETLVGSSAASLLAGAPSELPGRHGGVARRLAEVLVSALLLGGLGGSAGGAGLAAALGRAFGGGSVRVEFCDSAAVEALYPGEISSVISGAARSLLVRAGHSGRQWNFAMGRVLGPHVMPARNASEGRTRYTLPALQLRSLLADARAAAVAEAANAAAVDDATSHSGGEGRSGAFRLAYTRLPGHGGDEGWRAQAGLPLVVLREDGLANGRRTCRVVAPAATKHALAALEASSADNWLWADPPPEEWRAHIVPCAPCELALLPQPAGLESALGVWNPYPLVEGMAEEMHCFGP